VVPLLVVICPEAIPVVDNIHAFCLLGQKDHDELFRMVALEGSGPIYKDNIGRRTFYSVKAILVALAEMCGL
jgi:hypothetical protein